VVALRRGTEPRWDGRDGWADITRGDHLAALVEQGFRADVIVHLAGLVEIALQPDPKHPETACQPAQTNTAALYAANVLGTAHIVDLARTCGARKIVFASSQTVYGYGENGQADESTALRPIEHYATSKVCAEQLLETASRSGLSVVILRFPGIFSAKRTAGAVQAMCRSAVEQRVIVVNSVCAIPFDVLALEDVITGIIEAIAYDGEPREIFNLATGGACSLEILADRISALVQGTRVERRGVAQPVFRMNAAKAERLLGWRAVSLDKRLAELLSTCGK